MWTRIKCGEQIEESSDSCWHCSTPRGHRPSEAPGQQPDPAQRRLAYRIFRGTRASWQQLFREAAEFANSPGPERVVSISHSEDNNDGVVAIWYWRTDDLGD